MYFFNQHIVSGALLWMMLIVGCTPSKKTSQNTQSQCIDCVACERINLFVTSKELVDNRIWKGLNDETKVPAMLYFTDSTTYIAFLEDEIFSTDEYCEVNCKNGLVLKKLTYRLDEQPFHMENKMTFRDTSSMFYYRPMMLCSDVETTIKVVPEFTKTEDWLQLVMHEYFHSFQFTNKNCINYLSQSIQISADTLDKVYLNNKWFQKDLMIENKSLLNAIEATTKDSMNYYIDKFLTIRESRRSKYGNQSDFDLITIENFWETIEGTARYAEYYLAGNFMKLRLPDLAVCDSLFQNFRDYNDSIGFENKEEFKQRTEIMAAYYYVTGFNLCRLMDKVGFEYKTGLFDNPKTGLYDILINNLNKPAANKK